MAVLHLCAGPGNVQLSVQEIHTSVYFLFYFIYAYYVAYISNFFLNNKKKNFNTTAYIEFNICFSQMNAH